MWLENGTFEREFLYFDKIGKKYNINFKILTYGTNQDLKIETLKNVEIFPMFLKSEKMPNKFICFIKSLFFPFFNLNSFRDIDIIKTNQLHGSWLAIIFKLVLKKPLIVRTGFDALLFSKHEKKSFLKIILIFYVCVLRILFYISLF